MITLQIILAISFFTKGKLTVFYPSSEIIFKLVIYTLSVVICEENSIEDSTANRTMFIPRSGWNARTPKLVENFTDPAAYVIIHHSYIPKACFTDETCTQAMQNMQNFHMDIRGWNDIGYSFGIGGNGKIYTGRNFQVVAAHAPGYNNKSVGICLIGDWRSEFFQFGFKNNFQI